MGAPHSEDLRSRVVSEVEGGSSRRAAALRFKVGASSAIRWAALKKQTGSLTPKRRRKSRSPLERHKDWLLALVLTEPGLTLAEVVGRIGAELKLRTTDSSVDRFYERHEITFKKKSARRGAEPAGRGRGPSDMEGGSGRP